MMKLNVCIFLGHKFEKVGTLTVIGPGEPAAGGNPVSYGFPEEFDRFICKRCGEEMKTKRSPI